MNDCIRVLYVSTDAATNRRLESLFSNRRPDVELAAVGSVDTAIAAVESERVGHVVIDSALADRATGDPGTAIRHASADVRVHTIPRRTADSDATPETDPSCGNDPSRRNDSSCGLDPQKSRSVPEQIRTLTDKIENAVDDHDVGEVANRRESGVTDWGESEAPTEVVPDGVVPTEVVPDGGVDGEHFRALAETLQDALLVIDADSIVQFANPAVENVFGYRPDELVGESLTKLMPEDLAERHRDGIEHYLDTGERALDWTDVELTGRRKDGSEISIRVSFSEFTVDGEVRFAGIVRDASERDRRTERLIVLTEMMGLLAEMETPRSICDVAVDAAIEVLEFPNAAVALYDDEASALVPTVRQWRTGEIEDALLGGRGEGVAWQTFVESESRLYDDLGATVNADVEMSSVIAVPLAKHGVFLAAAPERDAFDANDASLADLLCSNVRSALDRAEREVALRDQRDDLRQKNRELERVNRLNSVIRELTKAVTQASSSEDVMQATCDRLAEAGPYRFAWFGEYDRTTDEVRPRASSGVEEGYLADVTVRADADDSNGQSPAGRAVRERKLQVQNDLLGDPPFEPWREHALKRGYRSCVSVPVVYGGSLRGVLSVYAGESGAFNELERTVLAELGETIGYAMNALEQKEALVSEQSIELDFRIRGTETAILDFVSATGAGFEFENVVQREDGRLHVFFTITDVPPEKTLAYVEDVEWILDARLVTERDGECLYECSLGDESFLRRLLNRGAIPQSITATDGEGRFVIRIPRSADVRTFVELFDDYYEQAELVARRERDEPVLTRQEFEAELRERLTDRQQEVLRMAYFGGFFEWPRESTAQEIADALGVSQPTVSRHVRGAERELFGLLFEEE